MTNSASSLAQNLFDRFQTTKDLKNASDTLESLIQNKTFKNHTQNIVDDPNLTDGQKVTQLLYVMHAVDNPVVYDFFSDIFDTHQLWLFSSDRVDYFDRFVREFQSLADSSHIVHLITSIPLQPEDVTQVHKLLKEGLGYRVLIDHQVNPSILGGAQVKIENYLFDQSLRSKLNQFQQKWIETLDETQSQVGSHFP